MDKGLDIRNVSLVTLGLRITQLQAHVSRYEPHKRRPGLLDANKQSVSIKGAISAGERLSPQIEPEGTSLQALNTSWHRLVPQNDSYEREKRTLELSI